MADKTGLEGLVNDFMDSDFKRGAMILDIGIDLAPTVFARVCEEPLMANATDAQKFIATCVIVAGLV